ncbi:hypothetical protein, partial [Streptomyces sp. KR55]|uniref:hypothetical protein n=1 Tax=Streptomyces sp. KR55 TaxID=3457425 RepID=UPI003FD17708
GGMCLRPRSSPRPPMRPCPRKSSVRPSGKEAEDSEDAEYAEDLVASSTGGAPVSPEPSDWAP